MIAPAIRTEIMLRLAEAEHDPQSNSDYDVRFIYTPRAGIGRSIWKRLDDVIGYPITDVIDYRSMAKKPTKDI